MLNVAKSIFLFLTLVVSSSWADLLNKAALQYFTNHHQSSVEHALLSNSCFFIKNIRYSTLCNPAFLPLTEEKRFSFNFMVGEDYQQLTDNEDLIKGDRRKELITHLITEKESLRLESALQMYFIVPTFSFSIEPAKWTYFSEVINSSYPDLAVHAMQEQSLQMQLGTSLNENSSLGVNFILSQRKYVHEQVNIFDAVVDTDSYFHVREEKLLVAEPAFHYEFNNIGKDSMSKSFDFIITNTGWRSGDILPESARPGYLLGFNISPKLNYGNLDLTLNYFTDLSTFDFENVHFGTVFALKHYSLLMDLSKNHYAIGTISNYYLFKTSLMFRRKILEPLDGARINDDGIFLEISTGI